MDMKNNTDKGTGIKFYIKSPKGKEAENLTKDDVFGVYDFKNNKMIDNGMVVARSKEDCPIFKDILPYKSMTVVCQNEQQEDVVYWLEYVHGSNCVSKVKKLDESNIAIRSDYQCW